MSARLTVCLATASALLAILLPLIMTGCAAMGMHVAAEGIEARRASTAHSLVTVLALCPLRIHGRGRRVNLAQALPTCYGLFPGCHQAFTISQRCLAVLDHRLPLLQTCLALFQILLRVASLGSGSYHRLYAVQEVVCLILVAVEVGHGLQRRACRGAESAAEPRS